MSLAEFRDSLQEYLRSGGISQKVLAEELGLHHQVFSRKLNGTSNASLTIPEVKNLIRILASWQILTTKEQVYELLELANLPPSTFSKEEWTTQPLHRLETAGFNITAVPKQPQPARASFSRPGEAVATSKVTSKKAQPPSNLPAVNTRFIGREKLVVQVAEALNQEATRLVTLLGPGGIGKTRLSLQVAREMQPVFEDGVFFVPLAGISDPALMPSAIAQVLQLKESGRTSSSEILQQYLADKDTLLVLDNLEQLTGAANWLAELLAACPGLKLLITSRVVLQIYGERQFTVTPLNLPALDKLNGPESLAESEAVTLFLERARDVRPDFKLDASNYQAVAEICVRLDGLALAVELAAACLRIMSPQTLLERLSNHKYELLSKGAKTLPVRHQSLRNTFEWSYDLLAEEERLLFSRFGVFLQGWTLEAAMAICFPAEISEEEKIIQLFHLLDHSLIFRVSIPYIDQLFVMLETLREYALEKLTEQGEVEKFSQRHACYYAGLAEQAGQNLQGAAQLNWVERLAAEQENLRAALQWLVVRAHTGPDGGDISNENHPLGKSEAALLALRMAGAMAGYWDLRGYVSEGRKWFQRVLALLPGEDDVQLAEARSIIRHRAGEFAFLQGDYPTAQALYEQSLAQKRQLGDTLGAAKVLNSLGNLALWQRDFPQAVALVEEALQIKRQLGDKAGISTALRNLGNIYSSMGNYEQTEQLYSESLRLSQELEDKRGYAISLGSLGKVFFLQNRYREADTYLRESLALFEIIGDKRRLAVTLDLLGCVTREMANYDQATDFSSQSLELERELGDRWGVAASLNNLGHIKLRQGVYAASKQFYLESLAVSRELGEKHIGSPLENLGRLALVQGNTVRAVQLYAAAEKLRQQSNSLREEAEQATYNETINQAHELLNPTEFEAAWATGQALTLNQAIILARQ